MDFNREYLYNFKESIILLKKIFRYLCRRWAGYYININNVQSRVKQIVSERGNILDQIGFIEGTDKSSLMCGTTQLWSTHDYLRHYDYLFRPFVSKKFSLIEFGCLNGASLRTWERYFPNAQIYGVDLDETAKRHETERIHIVIGDATEQKTFDELKAMTGQAFIILDDASHAWGDQRRSFELFWDMLAPEGFYVVEDLGGGAMGSFPEYPPKVLDHQHFSDYINDINQVLRWPSCEYMLREESYYFDRMPAHIQKIEREMDMCVFMPGSIAVRKKPC